MEWGYSVSILDQYSHYQEMQKIRREIRESYDGPQSDQSAIKRQKLEKRWRELRNLYFYDVNNLSEEEEIETIST